MPRKRVGAAKEEEAMLIEVLHTKTQWSKIEIELLIRRYREIAKPAPVVVDDTPKPDVTKEGKKIVIFKPKKPPPPPTMSKSEFLSVLHNAFNMTDDFFVQRVFRNFDEHDDGCIHDDEWVLGLNIFLVGTLKERVKWCFNIYALKEVSFINKEDIMVLLKNSIPQQTPEGEGSEELIEDVIDIIIKKMDYDNDGRLSEDDLFKSVQNEYLLLEAFGPCFPQEKQILPFLTTFVEKHPLIKKFT